MEVQRLWKVILANRMRDGDSLISATQFFLRNQYRCPGANAAFWILVEPQANYGRDQKLSCLLDTAANW